MDLSRSDALVFFGATGDLAYKQIFPALQKLVKRHDLDIPIIGVAKAGWNLDQLKDRARDSLAKHGGVDDAACDRLFSLLQYVDGDYNAPETYARLRELLGKACRPLHYLAIPPNVFPTVIAALAKAGCAKDARVVIEKPFGRDLASAQELSRILHEFFDESAIFRIDHFLGKEAVQNIFYTRFANMILEPVWNRDNIRSVQITMAENFGVQGRGRFYEEAGAIRDVIQNHLLQVLAGLAMDPPAGSGPESRRKERGRLLNAVRQVYPGDVVRGQFQGYRQEEGVAADSSVETYAAVKLYIDSWRWAGVPFFIRAGKCLPVTATEVMVQFKHPPMETFAEDAPGLANHLRLRLSPDVVIAFGLRVKVFGEEMTGEDVELIASHQSADEMTPYERLLGDALHGDSRLFADGEAVEEQWRIVQPALDQPAPCHEYAQNTWGPAEADRLVGDPEGWLSPKASP